MLEILHMWERSHIIKIVSCGLAWWVILLILYDFGKLWTSSNVYASQRSLLVGLWARAQGCPIGVSTRMGLWGDYVTNCHSLTLDHPFLGTQLFLLIVNLMCNLNVLPFLSIVKVGQFKSILGARKTPESERKNIPLVHHERSLHLPKEFDARMAWPQCSTIGRILGKSDVSFFILFL